MGETNGGGGPRPSVRPLPADQALPSQPHSAPFPLREAFNFRSCQKRHARGGTGLGVRACLLPPAGGTWRLPQSTPPARSPRYATPPVSTALPRSSSSQPSARHSRHLLSLPRRSLLKAHPILLVLANRKARLTDGPLNLSQTAGLRNPTPLSLTGQWREEGGAGGRRGPTKPGRSGGGAQ